MAYTALPTSLISDGEICAAFLENKISQKIIPACNFPVSCTVLFLPPCIGGCVVLGFPSWMQACRVSSRKEKQIVSS